MEAIKLMRIPFPHELVTPDGLVEAGREPEYKWLLALFENFTKAMETQFGKNREAWSDTEQDKCKRLFRQYLQENMDEHGTFVEVSNA